MQPIPPNSAFLVFWETTPDCRVSYDNPSWPSNRDQIRSLLRQPVMTILPESNTEEYPPKESVLGIYTNVEEYPYWAITIYAQIMINLSTMFTLLNTTPYPLEWHRAIICMNIKPTPLHLSGKLVTQLYRDKYKIKPVLWWSKVPKIYKEEYSINSISLTKEGRKAARYPKYPEDLRIKKTILFYSTSTRVLN